MAYKYSNINLIEHPKKYMYTKYEGKSFLNDYFLDRNNKLELFLYKCKSLSVANIIQHKDKEYIKNFFESLLIIYGIKSHLQDDLCTNIEKLLKEVVHEKNIIQNIKTYLNYMGVFEIDFIFSKNYYLKKETINKWFQELKRKEILRTTEVLKDMIHMISYCKDTELSCFYPLLSKFTKKYEVYRRIFSEYQGSLRKLGNDYNNLNCYILLALNLGLFYKRTKNIKFINATLKINDALCSATQDILNTPSVLLAYYSFRIEKESIEFMMHTKGIQ